MDLNSDSLIVLAATETLLLIVATFLLIGNTKKMKPAWKQPMTQFLIGNMVFDIFLYLSRIIGILTNNLVLRMYGPVIFGLLGTICFIQWGVRFIQLNPNTVKIVNVLFSGSLIWWIFFRLISEVFSIPILTQISSIGLGIYLISSGIIVVKMVGYGLNSPYKLARRRVSLMCSGIMLFIFGELLGVIFMSVQAYSLASLAFLLEIPAWLLISAGIRMPKRFNELLTSFNESLASNYNFVKLSISTFLISIVNLFKTIIFGFFGKVKLVIFSVYTVFKVIHVKISLFVSFSIKKVRNTISFLFDSNNLVVELVLMILLILIILKLGTEDLLALSSSLRVQLVGLLTLTLMSFAIIHGSIMWGKKSILLFFELAFVITLVMELIGTFTGLVFGDYYYTTKLGPLLFDKVPLMIPLIWFCLFYVSFIAGQYIVDHNYKEHLSFHKWILLTLTQALVMTFWDISKDVESVYVYDYWVWEKVDPSSSYFGIPISNYFGWLFTSILIFGLFNILLTSSKQAKIKPLTNSNNITLLPMVVYFLLFLNEVISHIQYGNATVSLFSAFTMGFVCLICYIEYCKRNTSTMTAVPESYGINETQKEVIYPSLGS
ncbi:MAG: carotenoid biosynthesis protein [Candidatus Kariarchaeaceae archaeon]